MDLYRSGSMCTDAGGCGRIWMDVDRCVLMRVDVD